MLFPVLAPKAGGRVSESARARGGFDRKPHTPGGSTRTRGETARKSTLAYGSPGSRRAHHREGARSARSSPGLGLVGTIGGRGDRRRVSRLGPSLSPFIWQRSRSRPGPVNDQLKPVAGLERLTVFPPFYTASRGEAGANFRPFQMDSLEGVAAAAGPVFSRFKRADRGVGPGRRRLFFPCLSVSRPRGLTTHQGRRGYPWR